VILIPPAVSMLNNFVRIPKAVNFVVNGKRKNVEEI
jgi:hypothetical protein